MQESWKSAKQEYGSAPPERNACCQRRSSVSGCLCWPADGEGL